MTILQPLKHTTSRTRQAYDAIKAAILSAELEPGTLLLEDDLAKQLKISKTPVRDALQELERDGLVKRIPYRGTYVTEIDEADLREILEIKAVLEGLGGRLATELMTPEELDKAAEILDAAEAAIEAGDLSRADDYGQEFHDLILNFSPNPRLLRFLARLDDQMHRLRLQSTRTAGRTQLSLHEHREILEFIRQGEPAKVESSLRDHLRSVLNSLVG